LKIEDARGNVLEEYEDKGTQVVDPQYPRLVNEILSSVELRSGLFTASLPLTQVPGYQVALKTGTTNDYVDAWTFGYTPNLVAAVWAGNNNRQPLGQEGSSLLAAIPMWHTFMSQALPELPVENFNRPDPAVGSHPVLNGQLIEGEYHSILHYLGRQSDSQYPGWENAINYWLSVNPAPTRFPTVRASDFGDSSGGSFDIRFLSPENGDSVNDSFTFRGKVRGAEDLETIKVYLNGALRAQYDSNLGTSHSFEVDLESDGELQGEIQIEVVDSEGNTAKDSIIVFF